jgi:hypothetical protein
MNKIVIGVVAVVVLALGVLLPVGERTVVERVVTEDLGSWRASQMQYGLENHIHLNVDTDYTLSHDESGSIIFASSTFGTTTLPAVRDGLKYTFQVDAAIATGNWVIDSREGDNIDGTLMVAGAVVDCRGEDQINFVTDGEQIGDYVTLRSNGVQWMLEDSGVLTSAKMTCTDPN